MSVCSIQFIYYAPHPHHDHSQHFSPVPFFLSAEINLFCGRFFHFTTGSTASAALWLILHCFSRFCCDPPPLSRHVIPLKLSREIFMFSKSTSVPCFVANWWCRASCHKLIYWVELDSILFTQRQTFFSILSFCVCSSSLLTGLKRVAWPPPPETSTFIDAQPVAAPPQQYQHQQAQLRSQQQQQQHHIQQVKVKWSSAQRRWVGGEKKLCEKSHIFSSFPLSSAVRNFTAAASARLSCIVCM